MGLRTHRRAGLLAAALMLLVREPRRERPPAPSKSSFKELAQFLRADLSFYACYVLAISMLVMMLNAIVSWMPTVLMRSFHIEPKAAGALFRPTFLIAGIAMPLSPVRSSAKRPTIRLAVPSNEFSDTCG